MPLKFTKFDEKPLVHGYEIEVTNEKLLAQYVGYVLLGYFRHVQRILNSKQSDNLELENDSISIQQTIDELSSKNKSRSDLEKRDGWIFQIISWIAFHLENSETKKIYYQIPHDAPAQHGIDGLAIILDENNNIERIIITEDKATENPRTVIEQQVWPEFINFEKGKNDRKLRNRISGMLSWMADSLLKNIEKDIYRKELKKYRLGITPAQAHIKENGRLGLFKNYDLHVEGEDNSRRSGDTFYQEDIREWFNNFSDLIIQFLESKKKCIIQSQKKR